MALAVSTYAEDEPQASIKMMDDGNLYTIIYDPVNDSYVKLTMDQAVAMALWIIKQNFEIKPEHAARIRVLPPRRNGDEGTRAERP